MTKKRRNFDRQADPVPPKQVKKSIIYTNTLYQTLYDEFGEEETHIMRRELTAKSGKHPSWIELMSALSLKQGPPTDKVQSSPHPKQLSFLE